MRIMMDLNVIVDIAEGREGFCDKSREAFEKAVVGGVELFFPIHGFTTLHYLLAHAKKGENSKEYISWLCDRVMCAPANRAVPSPRSARATSRNPNPPRDCPAADRPATPCRQRDDFRAFENRKLLK